MLEDLLSFWEGNFFRGYEDDFVQATRRLKGVGGKIWVRERTYPGGKRKSSSNVPFLQGYVSSQDPRGQ